MGKSYFVWHVMENAFMYGMHGKCYFVWHAMEHAFLYGMLQKTCYILYGSLQNEVHVILSGILWKMMLFCTTCLKICSIAVEKICCGT